MTCHGNKINTIGISDLHFGCPRLNARELYLKLQKLLYPKLMLSIDDPNHIHLLILAGDIFDTLITLNSDASIIALQFISDLITMAKEYKFKIRVIRGTYVHDRNQVNHFKMNNSAEDEVCLVYDTMSLEYIKDLDRWVLYMPDNLPFDNPYEQIEEMMHKNQLDYIDIIVNHGYFNHLLPSVLRNNPPHGTLDKDRIRKYIHPLRGYVINGHIHEGRVDGRVLSCGSFDLMSHGEENEYNGLTPVRIRQHGYWLINDEPHGIRCEYVHNTCPSIFITIKLDNDTDLLETILDNFVKLFTDRVNQYDRSLSKTIYLRLVCDNPSIMEACAKLAKETFRNTVIDKVTTSKHEQVIDNQIMDTDELPIITPDNLGELMLPIIQNKVGNISLLTVQEVLNQCK